MGRYLKPCVHKFFCKAKLIAVGVGRARRDVDTVQVWKRTMVFRDAAQCVMERPAMAMKLGVVDGVVDMRLECVAIPGSLIGRMNPAW